MGRVVLRYSRGSFVMITMLLVIMTVILVAFLSSFASGRTILAPAIFLSLITILIYGIVPMFTYHYFENDVLVLSQGLFFKGKVTISEIVSVDILEKGPFRTGVFFNIRGGVLYVTTRRHDLLIVKLRVKRRFGMTFGKSVDTLIFDCLEPQKAKDLLSKEFTPSNPALPS